MRRSLVGRRCCIAQKRQSSLDFHPPRFHALGTKKRTRSVGTQHSKHGTMYHVFNDQKGRVHFFLWRAIKHRPLTINAFLHLVEYSFTADLADLYTRSTTGEREIRTLRLELRGWQCVLGRRGALQLYTRYHAVEFPPCFGLKLCGCGTEQHRGRQNRHCHCHSSWNSW